MSSQTTVIEAGLPGIWAVLMLLLVLLLTALGTFAHASFA
jgi:hypothetical protein